MNSGNGGSISSSRNEFIDGLSQVAWVIPFVSLILFLLSLLAGPYWRHVSESDAKRHGARLSRRPSMTTDQPPFANPAAAAAVPGIGRPHQAAVEHYSDRIVRDPASRLPVDQGANGGISPTASSPGGANVGLLATESATDDEHQALYRRTKGHETWGDKMTNFSRATRDAFLILLSTVVITMAGHGFTTLPLIFLWIVLGLLVLWMISQLLHRKVRWIADVFLLLPVAVLSIIIWSLAFRNQV
ncbi:hypothetical protein BJ742DRAFT_802520 [Cladochytrium replicatum]|nr:hypothetical protein BJ742DRAFT_802520 [Cladochytrium replicatum]